MRSIAARSFSAPITITATTLVLAILAVAPASSWAQGFNLDFRGSFTGLPDTFGAASGQTGTWVDVFPGTTNGLIDVSGAVTGVAITMTGATDTWNPQTTTESILLRDSFRNDLLLGSFSATLTGLTDGDYAVYYYFTQPTSGLEINSIPMNDLAGGSPDAIGAQGTNWDSVQITVSSGTLQIVDTSTGDTNGLSGIQIVPAPAAAVGVPTTNEIGMILLTTIVAGLGVLWLRRTGTTFHIVAL